MREPAVSLITIPYSVCSEAVVQPTLTVHMAYRAPAGAVPAVSGQASSSSAPPPVARPPSPPTCSACGLPEAACPGGHSSCSICHTSFAVGSVGYPGLNADPAEVWAPPGMPPDESLARAVSDPEGHPLTWGRVLAAHNWLVRHASCGVNGYESDDDAAGCPCLWHQAMIEERSSHELVCRAWPGPICGSCWAASCQCGYVFDDVQHASGRWHDGRLRCHACDDSD